MEVTKPVIVVNEVTSDGGILESLGEKSAAVHPCSFINAGVHSKKSLVQTYVDLDEEDNKICGQKMVHV